MNRTRAEWNAYYPGVLLQTCRCGSLLLVAIVVAVVLGHVVFVVVVMFVVAGLVAVASVGLCHLSLLPSASLGFLFSISVATKTAWEGDSFLTTVGNIMTNDFSKLVRCSASKNALWIVLDETFGTLQFKVHIDISLHAYMQFFGVFLGEGGQLQFGSLDGDLGHHRHIFQSRISGASASDLTTGPQSKRCGASNLRLCVSSLLSAWRRRNLTSAQQWCALRSRISISILICDTLLFSQKFHFKRFVFEVSCFVIDPRGQICYICAKNFPKTVSIWANTHVASQAKHENINEIRIWCTWHSELNFQGSQKLALQDLAADLEHVCFFYFFHLIFASVRVVHVCSCQILSFSGHPNLSTCSVVSRNSRWRRWLSCKMLRNSARQSQGSGILWTWPML